MLDGEQPRSATLSTVFISLFAEGTAVWRPVEAEQLSGALHRLRSPIPAGERWEFQPGDLVRCRMQEFPSARIASVAAERVACG